MSLIQYGLVALSALVAGTIGGIAGYGTGLLMPLVLVPIVGAEAVVPIIGLSAVLTNGSRAVAFARDVDPRRAVLIGLTALPTCILGSYAYTLLAGRGASILIGSVLVLMIPVRMFLKRLRSHLSPGGVAGAGLGYGLLVGGTSGSGVVLLSILMASGLGGRAVIATDAVISLGLGTIKTGTFQVLGALPPSAWVMAVLVGAAATPGAFIARALTAQLPIEVHNTILDAAVLLGGLLLIVQGIR